MRYIVVSDLHGQIRLLENVLKHSNFDKENDKLISLGDVCDIGNQTMQIHELLFEYGAIQLVGNHEIAHMTSMQIYPYDYSLDPDYKKFIGLAIACNQMQLAYCVDNIVMTHAGLSKRLVQKGVTERGSEDSTLKYMYESGTITAELICQKLNERLYNTVFIDEELMLMNFTNDSLFTDWFYPLWFRPYNSPDGGQASDVGFYSGVRQIIGHTPVGSFTQKQQRLISESGVYLIDPYARENFNNPGYCKYAIIENGNITVVVNE